MTTPPAFLEKDLQIIGGLMVAMGADLFGGEPQLLDAGTLVNYVDHRPFSDGLPYFAQNRPLIIGRIDSREIAVKIRFALAEVFPSDHYVKLMWDAGEKGIGLIESTVAKFEDDLPLGSAYAVIFPVESLAESRTPLGLHALVSMLRSPQGCPWDREQTHASIRSAMIEEAYEVADAIDDGDPQHLAEELGDLALQVALHAQIALETGEFTPADVYAHVNRKLVRRHPHVFGDVKAETPDAVIQTWESVKADERASAGKSEKPKDPFDRLPRSMPVLTRVASVLENQPWAVQVNRRDKDALGNQLLDVVEQLVASGFNPEAALEQAYRRRAAANPESN